VREEDTVARFGGDEFVAMLKDLSDQSHHAAALAQAIGKKILGQTLVSLIKLGAHKYSTSSSIGLVLFSDQDELPKKCLKTSRHCHV